MTTKHDRILGAMLGCAIGDAMGAPTETRPTYLIKEHIGDGDYVRDYKTPLPDTLCAGAPKGLVTDDFSLSYLSLEQFVKQGGKVSRQAAIDALLAWRDYPQYYEPHSGPTSKKSIAKLKGEPYDDHQDYAATSNASATNGAGMKAWCAGLFNIGNIDKAIDDAILMCQISHDNPVALSGGCAVAAATAIAATNNSTVADVVKAGLYGAREGYKRAWDIAKPSAGASVEERIKMAVTIGLNYSNDFDKLLQEMTDVVGSGLNGNEAVPAAFGFFVAAQGRVMDAVYMGVNVGNDTDTVAAMAGAMAGAFSGTADIPPEHMPFLSEVNNFDIEGLAKKVDEATT